ncbi:MAG: glutamate--tRNA ligase [Armatimonadia bacterium]
MSDEIRVRFAPSPTGFMHIGSVHTAMFNYLFARNVGGKFILRIEDTDEVRSTAESVGVIYSGLKWMEMEWDEGPDVGGPYAPYVQSERLDIYRRYLDQLLAEGKAYKCYCTREDLEEQRQIMQARNLPPRYEGRCRTAEPREGAEYCIRLKVAETGKTAFNDLIQGEVVNENALIGDPVICKTSGFPTFHFAVVVDDYLMRISHVIRAADHVPNTQIHVQLQDALGFPHPQYAHLPLILGTDRTKLGKRHGSVSVVEYQEKGYLPEALFNFLALLGWSPGSEEEILSREEIVKRFTLEACSKSPAVFDIEKAEWMNGEYINRMVGEELAERVLPVLVEEGLFEAEPTPERRQWLAAVCELMKERARLLTTFTTWARYFFSDEYEYENRAREKWLGREDTPEKLESMADRLAALPEWTAEALEAAVRGEAETRGVKAGEMIHPTRAAVSGTTVGPSLFHLLELLPQETVVARLRKTAELSRAGELAPLPEEVAE